MTVALVPLAPATGRGFDDASSSSSSSIPSRGDQGPWFRPLFAFTIWI